MKKEEEIKQRYERLAGELNERTRRLFAANEAMALGWGGIAVVARATGLSRQVIVDGMQELRDGQFEHLNAQAAAFLAAGEPAVSVDAKKKELVGDFKNAGREWHPQGEAEEVRVYDFPIKGLGRATPYGVYDLTHNAGWVNVGIDHDTAAFAVESIRRWWNEVGRTQYPQAKRLLISAAGGGSNGSHGRNATREMPHLSV